MGAERARPVVLDTGALRRSPMSDSPRLPGCRQDISHRDADVGEPQELNAPVIIDTDHLGILPSIRVPMHVGTAVAEIEHPVLLNACPGVNRPLHKSVSAQRRA